MPRLRRFSKAKMKRLINGLVITFSLIFVVVAISSFCGSFKEVWGLVYLRGDWLMSGGAIYASEEMWCR